MGCGASSACCFDASVSKIAPGARLPDEGKLLENWDIEVAICRPTLWPRHARPCQDIHVPQEVAGWLGTLPPDIRKHSPILRHDGRHVAAWTEQFLLGAGILPEHTLRLLDYRDKAAAKAAEAAKQGKRESLLALLATGTRLAKVALERLGPSLPFPGAEAANLVVALLDLVDTAIVTHSNLYELRRRAMAFMDILAAYSPEMQELRYRGAVDEYIELLEGITAYARAYIGRNGLMRVLTSRSDKEHYEELVSRLRELGEQVMMSVAAEGIARLQAVQAALGESMLLLRQVASYHEPDAAARSLVQELGGLTAVVEDADKLRRVTEQLGLGDKIPIEMVTALLASHLDSSGPQRRIKQPDLRLFWKEQYTGEAEVPWFIFWRDFPVHLKAAADVVGELQELLATEAARAAFKQAVELSNPETISAWELGEAFSGDEGLRAQVGDMLLKRKEAATAASGAPDGWHGEPGGAFAAGGGARLPGAQHGVSCQLPLIVKNYMGRDTEAAEIEQHLLTQGSLLLLAPGGMGKSCLAADVGWRLLRDGRIQGGALWVDLREAVSAPEVEARFCMALGLQPEKEHNSARIVAALNALLPPSLAAAQANAIGAAAGGERALPLPQAAALVVLDNAEDALMVAQQGVKDDPNAANSGLALLSLLQKVCTEARAVRLLVTSRAPLPLSSTKTGGGAKTHALSSLLPERRLGAMAPGPASQLVLAVAAHLTEVQASQVAAACQHVPLVLGLMAKALVAGQLVPEDLSSLAAAPSPSMKGDEALDSSSRTVRLLLDGLRPLHQHAAVQLAVFPSTFEEEAAAAVLGVTPPQAQAILVHLHRNSMLQLGDAGAGGGRWRFIMHTVVRQQAMRMGRELWPSLLPRAEGRFISSLLRLLAEWAAMYSTAKQWRLALAMALSRQADISRVLELIGDNSMWEATESAAARHATVNADAKGAASVDVSVEGITAVLIQVLDFLYHLGGTTQGLKVASTGLQAWAGMGEDSAITRGSLHYMTGCLFSTTGHYAEAEAAQQQALELRRQVLGEEHPDTAASIDNLAGCIHAQGNFGEAEQLYRLALELRQQVLGAEHPDTADSINNLASCIYARGNFADAEVLYRQALGVRQRVLGKEHPNTAASISNLAGCIHAQGRNADAELLYRQALELHRGGLGEDHRDTAASLNNLAACIHAQGRNVDAEPLYRQALEVRQRVLGKEHPNTISSISNLAVCIAAQGRYVEAEQLHQQALNLHRKVLGEKHPDTAASINNLAGCIYAQGYQGRRYGDAERLYRQALKLRLGRLGKKHPDTADSFNNLAACVAAQGNFVDAEPLYRQALEVRQQVLGEEHPSTVASVKSLAGCIAAIASNPQPFSAFGPFAPGQVYSSLHIHQHRKGGGKKGGGRRGRRK